ncbi:cytochrome b N-terminal domain-containing protein [Candidatus Electronema sp. JM]|uniref:cytochrome b N-terminal domain-containing protein n=1 Tax=Candidatus Electronema sp. JM TaxID=3401571 RepID=UPI003AA95FA2
MNKLKERLLAVRWGGHSLISLYISLLSGLVLGLQYNPAEPSYSVATIELVVPFGFFWRSLHYYSSQFFFLLLLAHLAAVLWENRVPFSRTAWLRLSAAVLIALLLLFSGYILRGDATGDAAGAITENILRSVPLFGKPLNQLLADLSSAGLRKIYLHHIAGLVLLGGFCLWPHLRRYSALWRNHAALIVVTLAVAVVLKAPLDQERFGLLHIGGPWFFLGMQELLRHLPPFWAGIALPAIPAAALLFLPAQGRARTACLLLLAAWLAGSFALSGIAAHSILTTR